MANIKSIEVVEILLKMLRPGPAPLCYRIDSEFDMKITDPWPVFFSDIYYEMFGWKIKVVISHGNFSYIDDVIAPDGRHGDFDTWFKQNSLEYPYNNYEPDNIIYDFYGIEAWQLIEVFLRSSAWKYFRIPGSLPVIDRSADPEGGE